MNSTGIFFKDFQNELLQKAAAASVALYRVDSKEAFKGFDMTNPCGTCGTDAASIPLGSVVKYAVDGSKLTICFYIPNESYDCHECIHIANNEVEVFSCEKYSDILNNLNPAISAFFGDFEYTVFNSLREVAVYEELIDEDYDETDDDEEYDFEEDLDSDILDAWEESDGGPILRVNYCNENIEWIAGDESDGEEIALDLLREDSGLYYMDDDDESLYWLQKYNGECEDEVKQAIVEIIARHHLGS